MRHFLAQGKQGHLVLTSAQNQRGHPEALEQVAAVESAHRGLLLSGKAFTSNSGRRENNMKEYSLQPQEQTETNVPGCR